MVERFLRLVNKTKQRQKLQVSSRHRQLAPVCFVGGAWPADVKTAPSQKSTPGSVGESTCLVLPPVHAVNLPAFRAAACTPGSDGKSARLARPAPPVHTVNLSMCVISD
jgi:hypothetical protein